MNIGNLISGLIGALIATVLAIAYDFFMQRGRLRAEVSIIILSWVDGIYCQIQDLQEQAEGSYTDGKLLLTQDEYNATCRKLRNQLLSDELEVRLVLIYGKDSEEVRLLNSLQKRLMEVVLILWSAKKETWKEIEQKILNKFSQDIDPLRIKFKEMLLQKASSRFFLTK